MNVIVSVILPTYNRADPLERSICSVLDQSFKDLELIVVDDASTDKTERVVRGFTDDRLVYIRKKANVGAAAARNDGIARARGEYIAFQDSDDVWAPDKLAHQLAALLDSDDGVCASVCSYIHHKNGANSIIRWPPGRRSGSEVMRLLLGGGSIGTLMLICRADALRAIGCFDARLPRRQDFDLFLRLAQAGDFIFLEQPLVKVYHSIDSISNNSDAFLEATELIVEKHKEIFRAQPRFAALQYSKAARLFLRDKDYVAARRYAWRSLRWRINVRALAVLALATVQIRNLPQCK